MQIQKIVIIGAGAAGISAASKLVEAGFHNLIILEAENRIGGRINTIPFGQNVIDMGAQW
jgi:spermine oxidase